MKISEFGDPVLRTVAKNVPIAEIKSEIIQKLILDMTDFLSSKKHGVGLAAPQTGESLAVAIILIRPTPNRPKEKKIKLTIINPEIITNFGRRKQMWEGCISAGPINSSLFAKVPRYKKIKLKYHDEKGMKREKIFDGLIAQVIQHEVDHLNGKLFVDWVKDPKTYTTFKEYMKLVKAKANS